MTRHAFGNLRPRSYGLIMADPPWLFRVRSARGEAKSPQSHYTCMTAEQIANLPVRSLAEHDCILWLWTTHPMLPQAIQLMDRWGFTFKTSGVWVKRTRKGKLSFGTGYCLRSSSEPFLIGTVGAPKFANDVRTVVDGLVREHSRKPDEAYAAADRLAPDARRKADLFSRQVRRGWDCWGDEVARFQPMGQAA